VTTIQYPGSIAVWSSLKYTARAAMEERGCAVHEGPTGPTLFVDLMCNSGL